ncbi:MAG: hypothetical protein AAGA66_21045 [Bacteroidota bacterium]
MARVRKIKKGMSKKELKGILDLSNEPNNRGVNTQKYCGVLKWDIDPLKYQKEIRKEWDREIKSS